MELDVALVVRIEVIGEVLTGKSGDCTGKALPAHSCCEDPYDHREDREDQCSDAEYADFLDEFVGPHIHEPEKDADGEAQDADIGGLADDLVGGAVDEGLDCSDYVERGRSGLAKEVKSAHRASEGRAQRPCQDVVTATGRDLAVGHDRVHA